MNLAVALLAALPVLAAPPKPPSFDDLANAKAREHWIDYRIGTVSQAERVETTPGIKPEVVRAYFDSHRDDLRLGMRLMQSAVADKAATLWPDVPDADDRARLTFVVEPDGWIKAGSVKLQSMFLDVDSTALLSRTGPDDGPDRFADLR